MALNTTFTTGAVLTAAQMNNLPWGVAANVNVTTGIASLGTAYADLTGVTVTFTAVSSRRYKFTFFVSGQKISTAGYTDIQLTDSANVIIAASTSYAVAGNYWNCAGGVTKTGLSGTLTYKLRGAAESGTTNPTANAAQPTTLVVEDIGAA
jgi:hypothetical protein